MSKRPAASSPLVSRNMKKVRVRDTGPEMAIRRLLYRKGYRYRVVYRPSDPKMGRASIDIAFPSKRVAVFIDGCFWHGCPQHGEVPKANNQWWREKFAENKDRDARITELLETCGWTVLRYWSHEDPEKVCELIESALKRASGK